MRTITFFWSQSTKLFIVGKRKLDYVSEAKTLSRVDITAYRRWEMENSEVMSWLINPMSSEVGANSMMFKTAAQIWEKGS